MAVVSKYEYYYNTCAFSPTEGDGEERGASVCNYIAIGMDGIPPSLSPLIGQQRVAAETAIDRFCRFWTCKSTSRVRNRHKKLSIHSTETEAVGRGGD